MEYYERISVRVRPDFRRLERFVPMIRAFQSHLAEEQRRPESTVRTYTLGLKAFLRFLGEARQLDIGPENIDRQITLDFLAWCVRVKRYKPATSSLYFTALYLFLEWAYSQGRVREFVMKGLPRPYVPVNLPKPLAVEAISQLLSLPNLETEIGLRDRALMEILYGSGVRCTELLNLRYCDIFRDNIEGMAQARVTGKGNKQRVVPLTGPALAFLDRYIALRRSRRLTDRIFSNRRGLPYSSRSLQRNLTIYGRRAGIKDVHPHRFRHSMASHLIANGMPIEIIAELLGHSNLHTTRVYAQVTPLLAFSAYKKARFRDKLPV